MRRASALLLFALTLQTVAYGQSPVNNSPEVAPHFAATKEPVSATGVKSCCDLPASQHMRNTGGNDRNKDNPLGEPGKGLGLCVFTSIEIESRWQNVPEIAGFQKWMTTKPGGGFPQKVDQMLAAFCKEKGCPVPEYVQHTGGDDSFLDLAIATGRGCCVTYAGFDGFYRNRAGQDVWIDHMVVLAHLDADNAAIIDNNRPGQWVWMSRKDFLVRWRARGGGWAFCFLGSPPPPHLLDQMFAASAKACDCCGPECQCPPGCPATCPVLIGQFRRPQPAPSNCPDGKCPLTRPQTIPTLPAPGPIPEQMPMAVPVEQLPAPTRQPTARDLAARPGVDYLWREIPGMGSGWIRPEPDFDWGPTANGGYGWVPKAKTKAKPLPVPLAAAEDQPDLVGENYGLMRDRIHQRTTYSITGREATEETVQERMLSNDGDRWHLTAVGDPAFLGRVKADVANLDQAVRAKLHTQSYSAESWPIKLFALPNGVCLRKPATARRSEQIGCVAVGEYSAAKLAELLDLMNPKPPKPNDPTPSPDGQPDYSWVVYLVAVGVVVLVLVPKGR